jgi:predicted acetyltransferase
VFALVPPDVRFHASFLAAADEFIAAGEELRAGLISWPADASFPGVQFTRGGLASAEGFAEYVGFLLGQRQEAAPRPATFVPFTEWWMTDGEEYLGRISVRHRLTDQLLTWGGHIGYAVRPSARRQGYAAAALAQVLSSCAELGIDPVLVTCDVDNEASRRTIERNGGVYEDTRQGKLRYWLPTRKAGQPQRP